MHINEAILDNLRAGLFWFRVSVFLFFVFLGGFLIVVRFVSFLRRLLYSSAIFKLTI